MSEASSRKTRLTAYPHWIETLPMVDTEFPGARGRLLSGQHGQLVLWSYEDGGSVPPHAHGPQIGVVIAGSVRLHRDEVTTEYCSGDSFTIDDGEIHSADIAPGTLVMEIFAEHDRHVQRADTPQ